MHDSRRKQLPADVFAPLGAAALLIVAIPLPAYAYIDASTGSMLLQVLLGGAAGVAVAVKMLLGKFRLRRSTQKDADPAAVETPPEMVAARRRAGMSD